LIKFIADIIIIGNERRYEEYEENGMEYYIEVDYCCGKCCSRCNRRAGYDIIKRN
jgi:hypothetical protein